MSDDLMLDVEESLRQERLKKIWDEYGSSLITGMILAVLITAFIVGWRSWNQKVDRAQTVVVVEAPSTARVNVMRPHAYATPH